MLAEPTVTPVTTPELFTDATDGLLLLQVPPDTVFDNVIVLATHTVVGPVIAPAVGVLFTVTNMLDDALPQEADVTVYEIFAEPLVTPVTTPVVLTVATVGLLLLHAPPVPVVVSVVLVVGQRAVVPLMLPAEGEAPMVII